MHRLSFLQRINMKILKLNKQELLNVFEGQLRTQQSLSTLKLDFSQKPPEAQHNSFNQLTAAQTQLAQNILENLSAAKSKEAIQTDLNQYYLAYVQQISLYKSLLSFPLQSMPQLKELPMPQKYDFDDGMRASQPLPEKRKTDFSLSFYAHSESPERQPKKGREEEKEEEQTDQMVSPPKQSNPLHDRSATQREKHNARERARRERERVKKKQFSTELEALREQVKELPVLREQIKTLRTENEQLKSQIAEHGSAVSGYSM